MTDSNSLLAVKNIDHVTLVVADLDRSRDFYVGLLGMREVERPGFSFAGTWFQAGNTQIHLILEHSESGPAGNSVPDKHTQSRTHHLAFLVEDATESARQLKEKGISLISGPRSRPDGAIQVFLNDPDGHVIEITSPN